MLRSVKKLLIIICGAVNLYNSRITHSVQYPRINSLIQFVDSLFDKFTASFYTHTLWYSFNYTFLYMIIFCMVIFSIPNLALSRLRPYVFIMKIQVLMPFQIITKFITTQTTSLGFREWRDKINHKGLHFTSFCPGN